MKNRYSVRVLMRGTQIFCIYDAHARRKYARPQYWRDDYVHLAKWLNEREQGIPRIKENNTP